MLKSLLFLVFFVFVCIEHLQAQEEDRQEEVFKGLITIKPRKEFILSHDFKEGEEIIFQMEGVNGRKLNRLEILEPNASAMNLTARKRYKIDTKMFRVYQSGLHTFKFKSKRLWGEAKFNVRIEKRLRMTDRDTMLLDDILFTSKIDTLYDQVLDTVASPDITAFSIYLAPGKDMRTLKDTCIFEPLIAGSENQFIVYWIGIGDEALAAYEKLKNTPPPAWALRAVNEPVVAYGMRLTDALPVAPNSLGNSVIFRFVNPDEDKPTNFKPTDSRSAYFDYIPAEKLNKYNRIKLCIKNFNTSSGVNVHVRMAKFNIETKKMPKYIVRERTQEIYIKSSYETVDKSED